MENNETLNQNENEETKQEDLVTNYKKIDTNEGLKQLTEKTPDSEYGTVTFPSNSKKAYEDVFIKFANKQKDVEKLKLTDKESIAMILNTRASDSAITNDALSSNINNKNNDYVNELSYGDAELNTRSIGIKNKEGLSTSAAVLKLMAFVGQGEVVQVPLWHSGFWITLTPITQKELVNLSIAINDSQLSLGRRTSSLIYSNYSIVFIKLLTDFIVEHITDTTLVLPDNADIREYILLPDLYPLITGMISSMYPMGIDLVKGCVNTTIMDPETNKPKCDYVVEGKVDPKKLLWVNRRALTKKMLNQMASKRPNTVTVTDVEEYQNSLLQVQDRTVSIDFDNKKLNITFKTPKLSEAIDSGNQWVESVIRYTESLFKQDDTDTMKENKVTDVLVAIKANVYKHYIKSIEFDGVTVDDPVTIEEYLDIISIKRDIVTDFFKEVNKYITDACIAIIATPNYICPVCGKDQVELPGDFKEFIPLNVLENFFDLGDLRLKRLRENGIY